MRSRRTLFLVGVASLTALGILAACLGDDATMSDQSPDADAPTGVDSNPSASDAAKDASSDADGDAATVYNDMTKAAFWTAYDLGADAGFGANARVFQGLVYDGKHVLAAPSAAGGVNVNTLLAVLDPSGAFDKKTSWTLFDTTNFPGLGSGAPTVFAGAVFDTKYVYLVPYGGGGASGGRVLRLPAGGDFSDGGAVFDTITELGAQAGLFIGGAFDGKNVYFLPYNHSTVARYNAATDFSDAGSWQTYDVAGADAGATRYYGGAFDGTYLYLVPFILDDNVTPSGLVARFDSRSTALSDGWTTYDVTALPQAASGFVGAVFDGRYVYFIPYKGDRLARLDTTVPGQFQNPAAWQTFDVTTAPGVAGLHGWGSGTFDGRYVYINPGGGSHAVILRYDTKAPFTQTTSWQSFDIATLAPGSNTYQSCTFDGRFLYLGSASSGWFVRFDAKSPPSIPSPTASFL